MRKKKPKTQRSSINGTKERGTNMSPTNEKEDLGWNFYQRPEEGLDTT